MFSARETDAIVRAWGDELRLDDGSSAPGRFTQEQAELALAEGTAPAFASSADALDAIGLTRTAARGTRIESVVHSSGRTFGPFKVISYRHEDDGTFIELGLQAVT